ncbi:hypothetical protein [Caulobacter sp. S45]|uniref:hypothetical protein n=1 Tax=Caulobacter sp. S45 TaxID=1641861 RepID=UPI001574F3B2|nr:hypothetical protein [Caulobacter sp. S45]
MERNEAATRVAEALISTERALDDAFGRMAGLLGTVTQTRQDANWSILVGQDAVNEIAAALPEMTIVRDRIIAAHRRLDRWQKRMGVEAEMQGGVDKPPGAQALGPEEPQRLRVA